MTSLEILEDNEYFTAGVSRVSNGYVPFFQSHEKEDHFEEEQPLETEDMALRRLVEIVIEKLDVLLEDSEDLEKEEDVNLSKVGDNPYCTQCAEDGDDEENF